MTSIEHSGTRSIAGGPYANQGELTSFPTQRSNSTLAKVCAVSGASLLAGGWYVGQPLAIYTGTALLATALWKSMATINPFAKRTLLPSTPFPAREIATSTTSAPERIPLEEIGNALEASRHLIRLNDIFPDFELIDQSPQDLFVKYGKKFVDALKYDTQLMLVRKAVKIPARDRNIPLVAEVMTRMKFNVTTARCEELAYFTQLQLAKQGIRSLVFLFNSPTNKEKTHCINVIGLTDAQLDQIKNDRALENVNGFIQRMPGTYRFSDPQLRNIEIFCAQMPQAYLIDPLLNCHFPASQYKDSSAALYNAAQGIDTIQHYNRPEWNLEEIERQSEEIYQEACENFRRPFIRKIAINRLHTLLLVCFPHVQWKRPTDDSTIWTKGSHAEMDVLATSMRNVGLAPSINKIKPKEGQPDQNLFCLQLKEI